MFILVSESIDSASSGSKNGALTVRGTTKQLELTEAKSDAFEFIIEVTILVSSASA